MVRGVRRINPAAITPSVTDCGLKASSALPTPVQCNGIRPPTRELTGGPSGRVNFCRYNTSTPSTTAKCTVDAAAS